MIFQSCGEALGADPGHDCGECERFCPVGIPLTLVNRKLQQIVAERYDFKVGEDPAVHAPIGDYRLDDEQEFIK